MELKNKTELLGKLNNALDGIRPFLQADGGDIALIDLSEDLLVHVKLLGACGTCNMSFSTLKAGVEQTLRRAVPEIIGVIDITDL